MGDLDGDGPVEPRVARLVDGAEGAGPDGLDELELAKGARPTQRGPVSRCVSFQPEGGAASGAKDLLGVEIGLLDRALAMRACHRHGTALRTDVRLAAFSCARGRRSTHPDVAGDGSRDRPCAPSQFGSHLVGSPEAVALDQPLLVVPSLELAEGLHK